MTKTVINKKSLERIKNIHRLSSRYNRKLNNNHKKRLLKIMKEHIKEIEQLSGKDDEHYLIETGDLIILCFEILLENKVSLDETLLHCFKRYETKLPKLIQEGRKS